MRKALYILVLLLPALFLLNMVPRNNSDKQGIRDAVLDYAEGIYNVQPERIEKSVDVTLRKYGYWRPPDGQEYRGGSEMNFKQLYNLAATWNKEGRVDANTARKDVVVLDMLDKTASAKLVASWGVDYFHLAKEDGKWKIINVIWQSHPPNVESN